MLYEAARLLNPVSYTHLDVYKRQAGIFVAKNCRSCGIGRQLLTYTKQKYDTLSLNVYQKNSRAAAFYGREGFSVLSEGMEEATGEKEYTMVWKKSGSVPNK